MMTFRPGEKSVNGVFEAMRTDEKLTLRSEGDADCLCKRVNACKHGGAALIGEFNLLVSTTGEDAASLLRSSAAESRTSARGDHCCRRRERRERRGTSS
jgi:hypothetical protein